MQTKFFPLFLSLVLGVSAFINATELEEGIKRTRIDIGSATGNFIGIKRSFFEFGTFTPLSEGSEWVPFLDARGYYFQNDRWAANAGIGLRYLFANDYILGVNGYYDYLEGQLHASFHRAGVGFELLTPCFDIRVNGYFPIVSTQTKSWRLYTVDTETVYWNHREFAVKTGFDAEIGKHLFYWGNFSTYGAIGPYFYDFGHHALKRSSFWGGHARIEAEWNNYLSFQFRASYDRLYQAEAQFKIQFSIPIEDLIYAWDNCAIDPILQPVRRTGIIFSERSSYYNVR